MKFDCGCEIGENGIDFNNIRYDCQSTWDLLSSGRVQGVFQVESGLGKQLIKKLKPNSIEDMAALTSIMRPGVLKSFLDEKSLTQHYIDRKHGIEPVTYLHESLEPLLELSYGILIYQEQVMAISAELAGFNLKESDDLRKGIGKKLADLLAKLKDKFINGCNKQGIIGEDSAKQIFEWIYNSSRYSFNKCFSGDTIIKKHGCDLTIKEHYKIRNDINYAKSSKHLNLYKKWKLYQNYSRGYSLQEDGRIRYNIIKNITPSGIQQLYKITLKNGSYIRVTSNHKFPTPSGEKLTRELTIGDELYVCGEYEKCNKKYNYSDINVEQLKGKKYQALTEKIISIQEDGIEEVFDVEMEAPHHNLVTSTGIVACNSHAVSYGILGYWTGYVKAHFPLEFYTAWLIMSQEKPDPKKEIALLVSDAKNLDISILPPNIFDLQKNFHISGDSVRFGIMDVKGIGEKQADKLLLFLQNLPKDITWYQLLINYLSEMNSKNVESMISCGMLDFTSKYRKEMIFEYNIIKQLTDNNIKLLKLGDVKNLKDGLQYCIDNCNNKRTREKINSLLNSLNCPSYPLEDTYGYLADLEKEFLGVALSCNRSSEYNTCGNTTCKDLINGRTGDIILVAEITAISEYKITKKGKNEGRIMAYLNLQDDTGDIESCIVFPDKYDEYKSFIFEGAVIMIKGNKRKDNNLIIEIIKCL